MRVHVVVVRVLRVGGVQVEACARAKVPVRVLTVDACTSRGRVREQDREPVLRCGPKEATLYRSERGIASAYV